MDNKAGTEPRQCYSDRIDLLAVLPPTKAAELRKLLSATRWNVRLVGSLAEAVGALQQRSASVVLCDPTLPDGTWQTLLDHADSLEPQPSLLVICEEPDSGLWAEALNRGAYDLIFWPFDSKEVYDVILMAWRRWKTNATSSCSTAETLYYAHAV